MKNEPIIIIKHSYKHPFMYFGHFQNEIMTGVNDESNGVVSRFTLALYEDSG